MTPDSLRNETRPEPPRCGATGCDKRVIVSARGRPARYCSDACRARAHRQRHRPIPATAHVEMGSASARGRHPERAWAVHLRRGDRSVVIAIGLRRHAADRLAEQINDLLDGLA